MVSRARRPFLRVIGAVPTVIGRREEPVSGTTVVLPPAVEGGGEPPPAVPDPLGLLSLGSRLVSGVTVDLDAAAFADSPNSGPPPSIRESPEPLVMSRRPPRPQPRHCVPLRPQSARP